MEFLKVLYYLENLEFKEYHKIERSTTYKKTQGDLYPHEVSFSVLMDSSINIFGDHTGEPAKNLKFGLVSFEKYMTFPHADQPHLEIGLNNQRRILHQLYNLVIMTVDTMEELEISW
jgi:hypothetical protein